MTWDWDDVIYGCVSSDPLTRHNAHQAAKGRSPIPDPDLVGKAAREGVAPIECDGGPYCQAKPHVHGCFADRGDCDHQGEYHGNAVWVNPAEDDEAGQ